MKTILTFTNTTTLANMGTRKEYTIYKRPENVTSESLNKI